MDNGELKEVKKLEMGITNFNSFGSFLTDVDIILPKEFCLSRQGILVVSLSAGRWPTVMEVIAFQAQAREVES